MLALGLVSLLAACGGSTEGETSGSGGAAGRAGAAGSTGNMTTTNGMGGSLGTGGATTSTGGSAGRATGGSAGIGTGGNGGATLPDGGCTYDDPNKTYITRSPNSCANVDVGCPIGSKGFIDACGCGCQKASPKPGDGGSDAKNCLPNGMVCCDGDVIGTPWCGDADSSPYGCSPGFVLKPSEQCKAPPPDGGKG